MKPRVILVLGFVTALVGSLWLAYQLRFDFAPPADIQRNWLPVCLWVVCFKLFCLWGFRQFESVPSYFGVPDLTRLVWSQTWTSLVLLSVSSYMGSTYAPPRSVVLADFSFSVLLLAAVQLTLQQLCARAQARRRRPQQQRARRAGIIGGGLVGTALAQEFALRPELGLRAVAFFDDDRLKWGKRLQNVPVVGPPESIAKEILNLELEEAIIAMPSAPATRIAQIVAALQQHHIKFRTVPSFYELTTGQAKISQLRELQMQDLLGREQVQLLNDEVRHILANQVVMVTGAGGSIGSELCRQILSYAPRLLLLVDQSEAHLFQIEQELIEAGYPRLIVPIVADIQNKVRMDSIFGEFSPQILFHAAAYKHVPMMERHPVEAIKNNAFATLQIAEMASDYHIERFVFISTDKAINPTNVMGATKRLAEMCVQAVHGSQPNGTRFMAVRFGNVLGSSGSVVPIFKKQIAAGGPVKVTDPDVTRYFMTIPEAVGLVLQSAAQGQGGEIFTLDMGQPVKILDLARQLIALSGFTPGRDIKIEFTGLRPGEKLFEELSYKGENILPTRHPKIRRLLCEPPSLDKVSEVLAELLEQLDKLEPDDLKRLLQWAVPEYRPQLKKQATRASLQGETHSTFKLRVA